MTSKPAERALSFSYVRRHIVAAARLARGDAAAMRELDQTIEGFYRSFLAAALLIPLYVYHFFVERKIMAEATLADASLPQLPPADLSLSFTLVESLNYGLQWALFPLVMIGIARVFNMSKRYVPYIVAHNWSIIVTSAVGFIPYALFDAGIASLDVTKFLNIAVGCFVIYYRCLVAVIALEVPVLTAVPVVAIGVLLSLITSIGMAALHGL